MKRYNSSKRLRQLTLVEKICRYSVEMRRCKIKNLLQQMYSIAKFVENYIAVSVIQAATGNDVTLSTDNTFTTALIRSGLQSFLDAGHSYTDGDTFLYCSPASYMSALSLQDFYDASRRGDAQNPNVSGSVGMVYGVPTFVSTDWDDDGKKVLPPMLGIA